MEFLRYSRNVWGQQTLEGMAWDLLPLFFWLAVGVIVAHALLMYFFAPRD